MHRTYPCVDPHVFILSGIVVCMDILSSFLSLFSVVGLS